MECYRDINSEMIERRSVICVATCLCKGNMIYLIIITFCSHVLEVLTFEHSICGKRFPLECVYFSQNCSQPLHTQLIMVS